MGQDHILSLDAPIGRMVASGRLASMILWGPPGCGKTTIARLLAGAVQLYFTPVSAVASGVADLRKIFEAAQERRAAGKGHYYLSTKYTALTGRNRMCCCPMSKPAPWC